MENADGGSNVTKTLSIFHLRATRLFHLAGELRASFLSYDSLKIRMRYQVCISVDVPSSEHRRRWNVITRDEAERLCISSEPRAITPIVLVPRY